MTGTAALMVAGLGLEAAAAVRLSARWYAGGWQRWLAAAVLMPALAVAVARVAAGTGALHRWQLLTAMALLAAFAWATHGAPASAEPTTGAPSPFLPVAALPCLVGATALAVACRAGVGLPIWQWDSLGYHLPFVTEVFQAGGLWGVSPDQPYVGTYPHVVELWDLVARALMADDVWLDAAQLPLDALGAVAIAGLAAEAGAQLPLAAAAAGLWLGLPAVFLQLPTAYVDVPAASFLLLGSYWVLQKPTFSSAALAGVSLGLFVGTKPTAPVISAAVLAVLLARTWRACGFRQAAGRLALAGALALVWGGEAYLSTWRRHGNPLWPIRFSIGPLRFPGRHSLADLLAAGSGAPHLSGPLAGRLWHSWIAVHPAPAFDMRIGGFGPIFPMVLPLAGLALFRVRRKLWWALLSVAPLLTADPAIARYTLAFPGMCLALTAAELQQVPSRWRPALLLALTALAGWGMVLSLPGLTGNQKAGLTEMLRWPRVRQEGALLPASSAPQWASLRAELGPGDVLAEDDSFDLSYLLWRPELDNAVLFLPPELEGADLAKWLKDRSVKWLVGSAVQAAGGLARQQPQTWQYSFPCGASDSNCGVYRSMDTAAAGGHTP